MSVFNNNRITMQGAVAIAAIISGKKMTFTRMSVGDGALSKGQSPMTMTGLVNPLFDVNIHEIYYDSESQVTIKGSFSNADLQKGFYYRELGLFATDPVTGEEILFCYGNAGDQAEWISPAGEDSVIEKEVHIVTLVGNAENVTATIKSGIYPTMNQVQTWLNDKYDKTGGQISGNANITGTLDVAGGTTANTISVTGDASVGGTLTAKGKMAANGGIGVSGGTTTDTLKVTKTAVIDGALTASAGLNISGGVDVLGGIEADSLNVDKNAAVGGDLTANGVTTIGSTLQVKTASKTSKAVEVVDVNASAGGFYIYGHGGLTGLGSGASLQNVKNGLSTDFGGRDSTYKATFITAEKEIYFVSNAASYGSRLVHALTHAGLDAIAHNYVKGQNGVGAETHISLNDKGGYLSGNRIAAIELKGSVTGSQGVYIRAYKNAAGSGEQGTISIAYDWTKNVFITSAPTPPYADKSTQIATTAWVKNLIATPTEYGIMKVATPETAIDPDANDAAITPAVYHDVSDFRHKLTTYALGDKVECMFNHELWLECTKGGTTAETPLDTRNVVHGQVLTDGGVQWTVRTHIRSINGSVPDASGNVEILTTIIKRW